MLLLMPGLAFHVVFLNDPEKVEFNQTTALGITKISDAKEKLKDFNNSVEK